MMHYIGFLSNEIMDEEQQEKPNQGKLDALDKQIKMVYKERESIRSDNYEMINRALYVYAPIVKAFLNAPD